MHASVAGRLLVAAHHLYDPNFYRTVILVLTHDEEDGAMGLVLNRLTSEFASDYLPAWSERIAAPGLVRYGGPVDPDIAIGLGVAPTATEVNQVGLGTVDLTIDPDGDGSRVIVYSGYAGWGPGQLDEELRSGAWYTVDVELDDPFSEPGTLWQRVLQRQAGFLAIYSTFPDDPALN